MRTWSDEKFRHLTPIPPSGQGLWFFLLTGPHTSPIPGLFRAGRAAMAEELNWSLEAFDKAFHEVFTEGMAKADFDSKLVWLPKALKYNKPESANVIKSWRAEIDLLPECPLKQEALTGIREFLKDGGDGYLQAFDALFPSSQTENKPSTKPCRKPSGKACPNQEQEQEQEQDICDEKLLFEKFWNIYPTRNGKKLEKGPTLKRFQKLKLEDQGLAITAATNFANSKLVREGYSIKDPKRFLVGEKTEDGFDEPWRDWIEPESHMFNGNGKLSQQTGCVVRIQLEEFRFGNCGKPSAGEVRGKMLCKDHLEEARAKS